MGFGETELHDPVIALGNILTALDKYNQERNARPKPAGFENDVFPLMPFVLRAGELLPGLAQVRRTSSNGRQTPLFGTAVTRNAGLPVVASPSGR